jgi:hypothetical protein
MGLLANPLWTQFQAKVIDLLETGDSDIFTNSSKKAWWRWFYIDDPKFWSAQTNKRFIEQILEWICLTQIQELSWGTTTQS